MKEIIKVENLTKDYGNGKGVFNVSFEINEGEVFGFLGPNGAGKTTTIRHILGFSKPQSGKIEINGLDCWVSYYKIAEDLGYLPGEIAFPDNMTGMQYIKYIASLRKMKDFTRARELIEMFKIDTSVLIKKMSRGMKQKIGIITAFMHNPKFLILDEPTSGLDPLMQNKFIDLVNDSKKKGATILMSSHIFEEVEKTCDRIAIIRLGKIVSIITNNEIKHAKLKTFKVEFFDKADYQKFILENLSFSENREGQKQARVQVEDENINEFLKILVKYKVKFISEIKHDLEDYFMTFYSNDIKEKKDV